MPILPRPSLTDHSEPAIAKLKKMAATPPGLLHHEEPQVFTLPIFLVETARRALTKAGLSAQGTPYRWYDGNNGRTGPAAVVDAISAVVRYVAPRHTPLGYGTGGAGAERWRSPA
ncbi:hypothetical protein VTH82DRAFT_5353 [Thermothelomyces myriococcoides]